MKNDLFDVKLNVSNNPWFQEYETITFSRQKLQPLVDQIIKDCSNKESYDASYQYDHLVRSVLKNVSDEIGSTRPLLKALMFVIAEQMPKGLLSWHNPYVASHRSLESIYAWSSPGFAEARRYNEIYGG